MQRCRTGWLVLAALGLVAAGCGSSDRDADDEASDDAEEYAADETVFDDMLETKERARAVEDLNDERRELLESAIEGDDAGAEEDGASR
jgi:hypothetical protein